MISAIKTALFLLGLFWLRPDSLLNISGLENGLNNHRIFLDLASALGTLLAVAAALFGSEIIKWRNRPIIKVVAGNTKPLTRHTDGSLNLRTGSLSPTNSYWIRLKVKNVGKSPLKKCEGKLVAIAHNDLASLREDFDPVVLHWVGSDIISETTGSTHSIHYARPLNVDINAKEYEYLDLLCSQSDRTGYDIQAIDIVPRGINFSPKRDNYYFLLSFYSENAEPVSVVYKVVYGGRYDQIEISEATSNDAERFYTLLDT